MRGAVLYCLVLCGVIVTPPAFAQRRLAGEFLEVRTGEGDSIEVRLIPRAEVIARLTDSTPRRRDDSQQDAQAGGAPVRRAESRSPGKNGVVRRLLTRPSPNLSKATTRKEAEDEGEADLFF